MLQVVLGALQLHGKFVTEHDVEAQGGLRVGDSTGGSVHAESEADQLRRGGVSIAFRVWLRGGRGIVWQVGGQF